MSTDDGITKKIFLYIELIKLKTNKHGYISGRISMRHKYQQYCYFFKEKKEGGLMYYAVKNFKNYSLIELLTLFLVELDYRIQYSAINKYTKYQIILTPKFIKNEENKILFDDCSNYTGYEWNTNFSIII